MQNVLKNYVILKKISTAYPNFTHKCKKCNKCKMPHISLQNEARHSKYHKHDIWSNVKNVSKANICHHPCYRFSVFRWCVVAIENWVHCVLLKVFYEIGKDR